MKIVKTYTDEYLIEDKEAEHIENLIQRGDKFIKFSNGEFVSVSSINKIGALDQVPYWNGYRLHKEGTTERQFFMRDGQQCFLETQHLSKIELKDDERYELMPRVELLELEAGNNG